MGNEMRAAFGDKAQAVNQNGANVKKRTLEWFCWQIRDVDLI